MVKEQDTVKNTESNEEIVIPLRWGSFDHLETHYVNHVIISHVGPEFYVLFGELTPPFPKQRGISQEELPEHVKIIPKVKLALTPRAMLAIAEAINTNITRYVNDLENREQILSEQEGHEE